MHPATGRVWLALAGVCLGAVTADAGRADYGLAGAIVMTGAALVTLRRRRILGLIGIVAIAAGAGSARTLAVQPSEQLRSLAGDLPRCVLRGSIAEHDGGFGTLVRAEVDCGREGLASGAVVVEGRVGDPGSVYEATGMLVPLGSDPYDMTRARLGASAAFYPKQVAIGDPRSPPARWAARLRSNLEIATSTLDPRRRSLVLGLAIGDDSDMDAVTEQAMRTAGLSHLVAVSGSNVAIVVGAVAVLASSLSLGTRILLCAAVLGLYVLAVGPEPSVLRAALMGGILLFAIAIGRINEPIHGLGSALLILVLLRPAALWSVGLYLSAAATAGIVLWSQPIARRLCRWPRSVAIPLAVTLAAQIAVAPILLGVFGELPLWATVTNLAVVPVVAPATICALLSAVIGGVWPVPGAVLADVAGIAATWILEVADRAAGLPWSTATFSRSFAWIIAVPVTVGAVAALRARGSRPVR